jgi:hypothetical protein
MLECRKEGMFMVYWIVREYNNGTQFKPQKVRLYCLNFLPLKKEYLTYDQCLAECENRHSAVLASLSCIEVLKRELSVLEDKKQRMILSGNHPESRKLYEKLPVIGWQVVRDARHGNIWLYQFGWNGFEGSYYKLSITPGEQIKQGFLFDIEVPAGSVGCFIVYGKNKASCAIANGSIRFRHIEGVTRYTIYVKCESDARWMWFSNVRYYGCMTGRTPIPITQVI